MKKTAGSVGRSRISGERGSFVSLMRRFRRQAVRRFDSSLTSRFLDSIRGKIPYVRNRVIGTFLLTFGIYSTLIAVFKAFFRGGEDTAARGIYFSLCLAAAALPLIISRGTLYSMLSESGTGKVIGKCIGVRLQALGGKTAVGRENIAFLAGMLFGTLTFVFEPSAVMGVLAAAGVACLIMTYPEASSVFLAALLPFGNSDSFVFCAAVGVVSFVLKLIRGKRHLCFPAHSKVMLIFVGYVFCMEALEGSVYYSLLMSVCMLPAFSERTGEKSEKTMAVAVTFCTCVCAVYTAIYAVAYFGGLKAEMALFDEKMLSLLCAALIPVAFAQMVSGSIMPKKTGLLCVASMTAFLIVINAYMLALAALAGVIILLFFYERRSSYFLAALCAAGYAVWVWLGGSNRQAFDMLADFFAFPQGITDGNGNAATLICGEGIGGFAAEDNFLGSVLAGIGMVGVAVLAVILVMLAIYIFRYKKNILSREENGYGVLSALSAYCSALVLLICGMGTNIWNYESVFVLFWMMLSASASVAFSDGGAEGAEYAIGREESNFSAEITLSSD